MCIIMILSFRGNLKVAHVSKWEHLSWMTTYMENRRSSWVGNWGMIVFHLQERLNQVLMEKKKESRSGMEIMNLLQVSVCQLLVLRFLNFFGWKHFIIGLCAWCKQKEGRQRGTWNGKKTDNDFYKKIVWSMIGLLESWLTLINSSATMYWWQVDAYEAKNQELMAENTDLRALLRSMQVCINYSTVFVYLCSECIFICLVLLCSTIEYWHLIIVGFIMQLYWGIKEMSFFMSNLLHFH